MARSNKTQFALLGMLSKRPMSGYEIKTLMEKIAGFYWSESNAQIYPTLKKLEQENMLTSTLDTTLGKREKRIYTITSEGEKRLISWLKMPTEPCVYREELLLKLSLGQNVAVKEVRQWIKDYLVELRAKEVLLTNIIKHVDEDHKGRPDQIYLKLTYRFYQHQIGARIAWCDESIKAMEEK